MRNRIRANIGRIRLYHVLMGMLFFVFPLIVFRTSVRTYTEQELWSSGEVYATDFFLYGKMMVLYISSAFMLLWLIRNGVVKRWSGFTWRKGYLLLGSYGVCVIASTICSSHMQISLRGMADLFQPIGVLLSYVVLFFFFTAVSQKGKGLRCLRFCLGGLLSIVTVLGISQLFSFDILAEGPIASLLGGKASYGGKLIYLTLYHWNYVGSFAVLLLPLIVCFFLQTERMWNKVFWGVIFYGILLCLFGSGSRASGLGVFSIGIIAIIRYRRKWMKHWWLSIGFILSVVMLFLFCNVQTTGNILGNWTKVFNETKKNKDLKSMTTQGEEVQIQIKHTKLYLTFEGVGENQIPKLRTETREELLLSQNGDKYTFQSKEIGTLSLQRFCTYSVAKKIVGFEIKYKKSSWRLTNQYGTGYHYQNVTGRWTRMTKATTALPSNWNGFASRRGYVWSRTIPLLPQYILLGAGPDHYGYLFPYTDYIARYQNKLLYTYYVKPHNWYLQMFTETGGVSMLSVILFFVMYLVRGIRCQQQHQKSILVTGCLFAVFGYALTGLFNDSFLTVAPFFWAIAGIGEGLTNRLLLSEY